jgi:methionyl-tRNA synthetase
LPFTAVKIRKAININQPFTWADAGRADLLQPDLLIHPPFHLFEKIEDDIIERQLEKLHKTRLKQTSPLSMENEKKEDSKAEITFDDFGKLELRIGTILGAEKVEKADKLLKLEVDLGFEKRTIVSGIAEHFDSQTLAGKQVMVVVNLAPRKIRGIESKGMILLAEKENGSLEFATVLNEVQNGSIVR